MKPIIFALAIFMMLNTQLSAFPNPAASYCIQHGGKLSQKGQNIGIGICSFSDGSECSSWSYISGDCRPGMFKDWIDKNVSKKPQLYFGVSTSGYISNKEPPHTVSRFNAGKELHYSKKENGAFYYMRIFVQSRNQNARRAESHPAKILVKKNGTVIKSYPIAPIKNGGRAKPLDLFIPLIDKGFYAFYLVTTGGDEVQNSQEHHLFDNLEQKVIRRNTTVSKMTSEEIRAKRLAEWNAKNPPKSTREKSQSRQLTPDQIRAKRLAEWHKAHP